MRLSSIGLGPWKDEQVQASAAASCSIHIPTVNIQGIGSCQLDLVHCESDFTSLVFSARLFCSIPATPDHLPPVSSTHHNVSRSPAVQQLFAETAASRHAGCMQEHLDDTGGDRRRSGRSCCRIKSHLTIMPHVSPFTASSPHSRFHHCRSLHSDPATKQAVQWQQAGSHG